MVNKAKKAKIKKANNKAMNALMTKIGSSGETATNIKNTKKEYEVDKKPIGSISGKYNSRVHADLSDTDYVALHNMLPEDVDKKRFKKITGKKFNPNAKGGTVRMKSGGPVVDSYDYS
tara:strand:- start:3869 stop:4222 length:354 start_codon:yes stop_codon:yes gene_type:complete